MSIDFDDLLLKPIYARLGVPAILVLKGGSTNILLTVIDKTSGVVVGAHVDVPTILAAAAIRRKELTSLGLSKDDIIDGTLRFNDFTWTISNCKPEANPSGELSGELLAMLVNQNELASSES